jgi:hypothetical protein
MYAPSGNNPNSINPRTSALFPAKDNSHGWAGAGLGGQNAARRPVSASALFGGAPKQVVGSSKYIRATRESSVGQLRGAALASSHTPLIAFSSSGSSSNHNNSSNSNMTANNGIFGSNNNSSSISNGERGSKDINNGQNGLKNSANGIGAQNADVKGTLWMRWFVCWLCV